MNSIKVVYLDELNKSDIAEWGEILKQKGSHGVIDKVNWAEFPYAPETEFYIARGTEYLCIHYHVRGEGFRGLFLNDQEAVWQDACVEFFCEKQGGGYYNHEFNCLGTCLSADHVTREVCEPRTKAKMDAIVRCSSLPRVAFDNKAGVHEWELTVGIPFSILGLDGGHLPKVLRGNFYKCGDGTSRVHYVSWSEIPIEKPDFHRPDYFGELVFE